MGVAWKLRKGVRLRDATLPVLPVFALWERGRQEFRSTRFPWFRSYVQVVRGSLAALRRLARFLASGRGLAIAAPIVPAHPGPMGLARVASGSGFRVAWVFSPGGEYPVAATLPNGLSGN